jgi:hypothetical protein
MCYDIQENMRGIVRNLGWAFYQIKTIAGRSSAVATIFTDRSMLKAY